MLPQITYKADGYEKLYRQKDGSYNTKRDSGKKLTAEELKKIKILSAKFQPLPNGQR